MEFAESLWSFSQKLTENLENGKQENCIASPLSVYLAIAATLKGAKGVTQEEISTLLLGEKCKLDEQAFFDWIKWMINRLQSSKDVTVDIASKICISNKFELLPNTKSVIEKIFGAIVEAVEFLNVNAIREINQWVNNCTRGKITSIIDGKIPIDTAMMILNAVYFKGYWKSPFKKEATEERPFYNGPAKVKVPFMHKVEWYPFADVAEIEAKIVQLDYEDDDFSSLIILPNDLTPVNKVEEKLKTVKLEQVLDQLSYNKIDLFIPKFRMESTLDLKSALEKMNCSSMFSNVADFSGFSADTQPLQISKLTQKSYFDFHEKGTEAAAVSMTTFGLTNCPSSDNIVVDVCRPFIFYVLHRVKDNIRNVLFCGRICDPRQD